MSARSALGAAIAALRSGRPVKVADSEALNILSVETATGEMLALLDPAGSAELLISGHRAAALALANERNAADPGQPVLVRREPWLDWRTALDLVDPGRDFSRAPAGPLHPEPLRQIVAATAALRLARSAGLLPALWILSDIEPVESIKAADILGSPPCAMNLVARAKLPIEGLPESQVIALRSSDDGLEHVALVVGSFAGRPPLVRLHSECLTGDVFGSLKCDCGPQLREALRLIGQAGGGILLYLRQEGRGIGLANKIRAYALQDRGLDTVDSNLRLGYGDDERDYDHAGAILRALGVSQVRLLTNNPAKVAGLESSGIAVVERVAHHMPANPHNADYIATKRGRSGHLS